jgi:hypothetical protein
MEQQTNHSSTSFLPHADCSLANVVEMFDSAAREMHAAALQWRPFVRIKYHTQFFEIV